MNRTRALAAGLVAAATLIAPAAARAANVVTPPPVDPLPSCAAQEFSQRLLALKDNNYYTVAPGGEFEDGTTDGWQLSGGAGFVQAPQLAGALGTVLELPTGAQATSPPMCITTDYPTARLAVRNVTGGDGVSFDVQYLRNGEWSAPRENGKFHGPGHSEWALSSPLKVQPDKTSGWQQVRFTFVAGGKGSVFQVDDFLVDPRARF
jgi:hypothetical protein